MSNDFFKYVVKRIFWIFTHKHKRGFFFILITHFDNFINQKPQINNFLLSLYLITVPKRRHSLFKHKLLSVSTFKCCHWNLYIRICPSIFSRFNWKSISDTSNFSCTPYADCYKFIYRKSGFCWPFGHLLLHARHIDEQLVCA